MHHHTHERGRVLTPDIHHTGLTQIHKELGFVPNLFEEMNTNPVTVLVYLQSQEVLKHGLLTPKEQQAVQLRVSVSNDCDYCQAAHRWLGRQSGLLLEDIAGIASGKLPAEDRLASLMKATDLVLAKKGRLASDDLAFLERQGVARAQFYEIIAFMALKMISNYINHIAHTPIDEQFGK